MNMKDMIQRMTGIQDTKNDQLNESIIECGDMPPAPMEMDRGNPVSINVSMNASGKDHVEDLLDMMKKAGLGGAEEVKPDMMPMRHDMEKFRGMIDGPKDDEPVMKLPAPDEKPAMAMDSIEEGGMKDELIQAMEKIAADDSGELLYKALSKGAMGPEIQKYLQDMYDDVARENGLHPDDDHDDIEQKMWDQIEADYGIGEGYDNEPDEEYKDTEFMTKDLAGGINREKKAYKAAQDGDNAMAVETLYKELMSQYKALK